MTMYTFCTLSIFQVLGFLWCVKKVDAQAVTTGLATNFFHGISCPHQHSTASWFCYRYIFGSDCLQSFTFWGSFCRKSTLVHGSGLHIFVWHRWCRDFRNRRYLLRQDSHNTTYNDTFSWMSGILHQHSKYWYGGIWPWLGACIVLFLWTMMNFGLIAACPHLVFARPELVEPQGHRLLSAGGLSLCHAHALATRGISAWPRRHLCLKNTVERGDGWSLHSHLRKYPFSIR